MVAEVNIIRTSPSKIHLHTIKQSPLHKTFALYSPHDVHVYAHAQVFSHSIFEWL